MIRSHRTPRQLRRAVVALSVAAGVLTLPTGAAADTLVPSFTQATSYSMGTKPRSVAVADFNRDGKQDVVTASQGSNGAVRSRSPARRPR